MEQKKIQIEHTVRQTKTMLIDIHEASELLGLKVSRLRMAVFRREIPYRKIGGLVRFVPQELAAWVDSEILKPKGPPYLRG